MSEAIATKPDQQQPTPDDGSTSDLPPFLAVELELKDADLIRELVQFDGEARTDYALGALRIGILALRQARGQIDTEAVRRECDRMLRDVEVNLKSHQDTLNERLNILVIHQSHDACNSRGNLLCNSRRIGFYGSVRLGNPCRHPAAKRHGSHFF